MKILLLFLLAAAPQYRQALPGYVYQFPRDHFEHPDFRTEWWYYTGNVHARDGHRYGFELVFFRQGDPKGDPANASVWRIDDLYLAHLALTDIDGRRFRYYQRLNRSGPGVAGARAAQSRVWSGNWEAKWDPASGAQTLTAAPAAVDSRRERRQPEGRRRGQGIVLRLLPAPRCIRLPERRRGRGSGLDGPRMVHPPTGTRTAGLGLVQRPVGFRRGTDAVPTAPRRRHGRRLFGGHLHRSRWARHAPQTRGFPTPAARLLDQFPNPRTLPHPLAHHRTLAAPRAGVRRRPGIPGAGVARRVEPQLLGRRRDLQRDFARCGLSGDDGLSQSHAAVTRVP